MAEQITNHYNYGDYEGKSLGPDVLFAIQYVETAGEAALSLREMAAVTDKIDRTLVTTADKLNHRNFVRQVRHRYGPRVRVHSEEGQTRKPGKAGLLWCADTLDGTGQYAADWQEAETGQPIRPGDPVPEDAVWIDDAMRSTSVGVALFNNGEIQLAAAYNIYQDKLYVAERALGAAYLNGHRLDISRTPGAQQGFGPGTPYDIASWRGSILDPRHLRRDLGGPPNGTYSAIMQGCEVAEGASATAVFTGATLHDMAVPAFIVEMAGGVVTDLYGNPIDWDNLQGAVYSANSALHKDVINAINATRIDGLPPGYAPVGKGDVNADEVLKLRQRAKFGTEDRLAVWEDALARTYAFVGAREIATGRLALASFLTGSSRHGTLHDLVVDVPDRFIGLASYAIDKRMQLAEKYEAGGEEVGIAYVEVDLDANELGMIPLAQSYRNHGFVENKGAWIRNYRHGN